MGLISIRNLEFVILDRSFHGPRALVRPGRRLLGPRHRSRFVADVRIPSFGELGRQAKARDELDHIGQVLHPMDPTRRARGRLRLDEWDGEGKRMPSMTTPASWGCGKAPGFGSPSSPPATAYGMPGSSGPRAIRGGILK